VHDVLAAVVGDAEEEPLAAAGTDAGFLKHSLGKQAFDIIYDIGQSISRPDFPDLRCQRSPSKSTITRAKMLSQM
jgi:hypothetical protein